MTRRVTLADFPGAPPDERDVSLVRVQLFLEGVRAVWMGRACLTVEGALYLGVPYFSRVPKEVDEQPEATAA